MKKPESFVKLPLDALYDERLTPRSVLCLAALIDLSDAYGMCYPGLSRLAYILHCDERTVRRSLKELVDTGYITINRTGRESLISIEGENDRRDWSAIKWYEREQRKHWAEEVAQ